MKYLRLFEDFKHEEKCDHCAGLGHNEKTGDMCEWCNGTGNSQEESHEEESHEEESHETNEAKKTKKAKPDFLDLDKDGDKKESMKKAAKEAAEKKGEKKGGKLTAAQKKLPEGLRKAIEAKKKK
jgi:hypothetical protein